MVAVACWLGVLCCAQAGVAALVTGFEGFVEAACATESPAVKVNEKVVPVLTNAFVDVEPHR